MSCRNNWIFISAGQSNAGTSADLDDATSPTYDAYISDGGGELVGVRLARQINAVDEQWGRLEAQSPTSAKLIGPELSLGRDLNTAIGATANVWIIQSAYGGAALGPSASNADWDPAAVSGLQLYSSMKSFYDAQVARITASENTPGPVRFGGFVWTQGESDGNNQTHAQEYDDNLAALQAQVDSDFGVAPFVVTKLGSLQTAVNYPADLRTSQDNWLAAARAGSYLNDTDGLAVEVDNLHFVADSQIVIGQLSAADIIAYWGW